MKYDKLVRDKIPDIVKSKGETATTHIAGEEEYWSKLKEKLSEEVKEFAEEKNIPEELADILEVIRAICSFKKIEIEELEKIRIKKAAERGGFENRIILEETN